MNEIITINPWQFAMWVGIGIILISCIFLEEGKESFERGIKEVEDGQLD